MRMRTAILSNVPAFLTVAGSRIQSSVDHSDGVLPKNPFKEKQQPTKRTDYAVVS